MSRRSPHRTEDDPVDLGADAPEEAVEETPGDAAGGEARDDGGDATTDEAAAGEGGLAEAATSPEEVESLRSECTDLRDALVRQRADFENYRRRVERDRHVAAQEALASVFRELVGTVDNFERALAAEGGGERFRQGVELIHREITGLLEAHGVAQVDPVGEAFDPQLHQALVHEPVSGVDEGTVAEVYRKGYTFGDRLLRPALVKVAKGGDESDADA